MASNDVTYQSDVLPLRRVLLKHARDAFVSDDRIGAQWGALGYLRRPDFAAACREYDDFAGLLERLGVRIEWLAPADTGLDSIYVRDASIVSDLGAPPERVGSCGLVVPVTDRAPLQAAIDRLIDEQGLRDELRSGTHGARPFTATADRFAALYQDLAQV